MKLRIFNLIAVVMAFVATATAQSLSVATIETEPDTHTEIVVSITGAAEATALQFNLELPSGLSLAKEYDDYGITLGSAAAGHTLCVEPLASGDLMVVLYSLSLGNLGNGELISIPVVAGSEAGTTEGRLYTVHSATADATSKVCSDVDYSATVKSNSYNLAVTEAGYATLYLGFNSVIPADVEVYYAKSVKGSWLIMEPVTGCLPANTAVIVKAAEGTYRFDKTDEAVDAIEGNLLDGTLVDTYITAEEGVSYYALAMIDGVVGMYAVELNDNTFLNNANKAYLALTASNMGDGAQPGAGYRFDFDGSTGIEEVKGENTEVGTVFDLTGRRVEIPTTGIYIVNGKKMLIK